LPEARKAFLYNLLGAPEPPDFREHLDASIQPLFASEERRRHPGGRPSGYSTDIARSICAYMVCLGTGIAPALRHHGISRTTGWRWRNEHAFFDLWVAKANGLNGSLGTFGIGGVMKRYKLSRRGTVSRGCFVSSRSCGFKVSMVKSIMPGIRSTARELGVSPSTVIRWSRKHYHEFGVFLDRIRVDAAVDKIKRKLNHQAVKPKST